MENNTTIPKSRYDLTLFLRTFLSALSSDGTLYYPTPGNGGDCVIQVGTYQALRRARVNFKPVNLEHDVRGKTVILGGGANLTPLYNELRHALLEARMLEHCERLIILPHTIRGNEDLLKLCDDRVTIFCRDPESYIHVLRHAPTTNVYLDHDMALHIDIDQFYQECLPYTDVPQLFDTLVTKAGHVFETDDHSTVRSFFRTDGERLSSVAYDRDTNLDISKLFELGTWPVNSYKATWCFFEAIRRSGMVLTDRLHVGIASSILGKDCTFYDNSYGKNRTVYDHSIRKYEDPRTFKFVRPAPAV